jgi:hypothetical protein
MSRRHHGRPHHGRHRNDLPRPDLTARPSPPSAVEPTTPVDPTTTLHPTTTAGLTIPADPRPTESALSEAATASPAAPLDAPRPPPAANSTVPTNGYAINGHATNGQPTNSQQPNGQQPNGQPTNGHAANGEAASTTNGAARDERSNGCTAPQLRRFIKSRPYVPMHELRRRFAIDGNDDDVTQVPLQDGSIYVGLPAREGSLLGELLRGGEIGYELSFDPRAPIVVGVYPMRPVPRP